MVTPSPRTARLKKRGAFLVGFRRHLARSPTAQRQCGSTCCLRFTAQAPPDCDYRLRRSGRDDRSGARSGAADYLLKPINPDLLRTAVAAFSRSTSGGTPRGNRADDCGPQPRKRQCPGASARSGVANLAVEVRSSSTSISSGNCKKPRTICTAFMAKCEVRRPSNWNSCLGMSASGGKLGRK